MLRNTVIIAVALGAFAALASHAAVLDRPPFDPGTRPIEPGILDPVSDCLRFPQLCNPTQPPQPPPDPCFLDPDSCPPEPPCVGGLCPPLPLCEVAPSLCEDPPVAEPVDEEPPEQEVFDHRLTGTAKVKARGGKSKEPYTLLLTVDTIALTFSAMDESGTLYTGNLVPKGKKGLKFKLFLDSGSSTLFEADVASRGLAASGLPSAPPSGGATKLTLKLNQDGSASLRMKSEVLVPAVGEIVFKANLLSQP